MKKIISALSALALAAGLFACGPSEATKGASEAPASKASEAQPSEDAKASDAKANEDTKLSGKLVASGSTSVQPLMEVLAEEFTKKNPGVTIEVQAGGSTTGFKNVVDKVTEVGNLSRNLKEEEAATPDLKSHTIAIDGVAVVVHKDNKVADLSMEQIAKIFSGEIKNWSEVGGADGEIAVVSREAGSGTRGAFEEIVGVQDKVEPIAANTVNETGVVKNTVAQNPNAIGYISLGSLDDTVNAVKVDGVVAKEATVADGSYKIQRPFLSINLGEESAIFKAFLDFIASDEGTKIVLDKGYFPYKA